MKTEGQPLHPVVVVLRYYLLVGRAGLGARRARRAICMEARGGRRRSAPKRKSRQRLQRIADFAFRQFTVPSLS